MALTIVDKARLLHGIPLLSEVPTEVLADLATLTTVRRFDTETTLFEQGDPAEAFYFVIKGEVCAYKDGKEIYRAAPGEEVGALAVLDGRPRAVTAVAEAPCELLRIGGEDFHYLVEQYNALAKGVIRHLALELRAALRGESRYRS